MKNAATSEEADFVIVGSGASGATAAVEFAENGFSTLVVEEGEWYRKENFTEDVYGAMATLFRDFGSQMTKGRAVIPVLEGRAVGGSTVMNGAIVHRLPEEIYAEWLFYDASLKEAFSYSELEKQFDSIEKDLQIRQNLNLDKSALPVSAALNRLNWAHQSMKRNAPGCESSGRCLQGCPTGGKWSMEVTFIPRAMKAGARVLSGLRAMKVIFENGTAVAVECVSKSGETKTVRARRGVVLAGGVMQTPQLLWRSGIGLGKSHVGRHFQTHLGVSMVAEMGQRASELEGPPQGIEILAFNAEKMKLATQLIPPELVFARTSLGGVELARELSRTEYYSSWTGSVQAEAEGRLVKGWTGKTLLQYTPTKKDIERVRNSLWRLAQLQFEMGAKRVFPGINGPKEFPRELRSLADAKKILDLPLDPRLYLMSAGHLFGTTRLGTNPKASAVNTDYSVHGAKSLFVVDAGLFPTNIGVNPQHSVMAIARHASQRILEAFGTKRSSEVKSVAGQAARPMSTSL